MRRGGVLVDRDIRAALRRGDLVVTDLDPALVRPAAVSLRLGGEAFVLRSRGPVDVADPATFPELVAAPVDGSSRFVLGPGEVLLARTHERIGVSDRLAGLLDGTSDWARLGVSVVLAHQVSPGYGMPDGSPLTLEIVSRLDHDLRLPPGIRIANLMLLRGRRARRSYLDMPAHHSTPEWSVASRLFDSERTRMTWLVDQGDIVAIESAVRATAAARPQRIWEPSRRGDPLASGSRSTDGPGCASAPT